MNLCGSNHHNWHCTLNAGHEGDHADRSLVDGFVYMTWPRTLLEREPWRRHIGFPEDADLDPVAPC